MAEPGRGAGRRLGRSFFDRPTEEVARELLGCRLVLRGSPRLDLRIVEVEAYVGPHDPASHAAERIGRTERNRVMFGPAGLAYVYRSYGIHWCVNVVTGAEGHPEAVLLRGLTPLDGIESMIRRRGRSSDLCSGPGRLCQALGITGALDGHDLDHAPLVLRTGSPVPIHRIHTGPRIGISRAVDWPLRFWIDGEPT